VTLVFGFMKSSVAYSGALDRARAAPAVIAALGTPIRDGFFVAGNISVNGQSGKAELAIPISGPKGDATVYVVASEALGEWHFERIVVQIDRTGRRIDLLAPPSGRGLPTYPAAAPAAPAAGPPARPT